jgi:tetratricopeptide (TPR) repeat protein
MNNTRLQKLLEMSQENSSDTFVQYALGMEYKGLNQNDLAEHFLLNCLQIDSNYVPAYYQLALLYQAQNKEMEAINCLNKGFSCLKNGKDQKTKNEFQSLLDELMY